MGAEHISPHGLPQGHLQPGRFLQRGVQFLAASDAQSEGRGRTVTTGVNTTGAEVEATAVWGSGS